MSMNQDDLRDSKQRTPAALFLHNLRYIVRLVQLTLDYFRGAAEYAGTVPEARAALSLLQENLGAVEHLEMLAVALREVPCQSQTSCPPVSDALRGSSAGDS